MAIYSEFSHQKWWFSIATLNYQRVCRIFTNWEPPCLFHVLCPDDWGLINQTPPTFTPWFCSERKHNMFFTHQLHHTKLPFSLIIFPLFPCFQTTYPHPSIRAPLVNGFAGSIEGSTWQLSKLRNFTTCQKIIWKTSNH